MYIRMYIYIYIYTHIVYICIQVYTYVKIRSRKQCTVRGILVRGILVRGILVRGIRCMVHGTVTKYEVEGMWYRAWTLVYVEWRVVVYTKYDTRSF